MTLQHGKFYIGKRDLLDYLNMPDNSGITVEEVDKGFEFYVTSPEENPNLTEKKGNEDHLRRIFVSMISKIPKYGVSYDVYEKDSLMVSNAHPQDESSFIEDIKNRHVGVTVVKKEVIYYEK